MTLVEGKEPKQEMEVTVNVPAGYREDARLDVYLTRVIVNATRAKVQRGIKAGRVTVNGHIVTRSSHLVQAGDVIVCRLLRPPPIEAAPENIPLDIVYEDEWLIIVNKPAGMVVHPAYGNRTGTLVNALLHHVGAPAISVDILEESSDDPGLSTAAALPAGADNPAIRPGIVHRLDKDTSGLLVVARDDTTHAALARQFAERTIDRDYLGIVLGLPDPPDGVVDAPIGRDRRDRKKMTVVRRGAGKSARTHYETVTGFQDAALVRFRLETGRTHQIRVHAAHVGYPVLGDDTYGGCDLRRRVGTKSRRAFFRNLIETLGRQALHARSLGFVHPATQDHVVFECPLPPEMAEVLGRLEVSG